MGAKPWSLKEVERLWDAEPGTKTGDRVDVLVTLIEAYEAKHYPIQAPRSDRGHRIHDGAEGTDPPRPRTGNRVIEIFENGTFRFYRLPPLARTGRGRGWPAARSGAVASATPAKITTIAAQNQSLWVSPKNSMPHNTPVSVTT